MSTFTQLIYQLVFGGKYRHAFLHSDTQDQLFAYIGGILNQMGCKPLIVGGHIVEKPDKLTTQFQFKLTTFAGAN